MPEGAQNVKSVEYMGIIVFHSGQVVKPGNELLAYNVIARLCRVPRTYL